MTLGKIFSGIISSLNEAKCCANKTAFLYESLDRTFKELTWELSNLIEVTEKIIKRRS